MIDYLLLTAKALALLFVFYAFLFTFLRWIRKHGLSHHWFIRPLFILFAIVFVIADWWVNIIISFAFLDPPKTLGELVTGRMKRYKRLQPRTFSPWLIRWRYSFAVFICKHLNEFDKDHC